MANKKYLSDYAFRDPENRKAGFDYVGQYYFRIAPDKESFRKRKKQYFLFIGLETLFYAGAGVLSNPGMITFYEALPYAVNFLPLFLAWICCMDIAFSPLDMTRKAADISVKRLKNVTITSFVLQMMCALASLGFLLFAAGKEGVGRETVYLALNLAGAAAAYIFMGAQGKAGLTRVPNERYQEECGKNVEKLTQPPEEI